jgi:flavin-dependent dehydrogenase
VGVVLNHAYLRTEKERLLSEGSKAWQLDLYRQELFTSSFMADVLADARIIMPLMFNGDYSYSVTKKYGPNFAMVGDASAFIDPIFATGVYLSMNSSRLVSDVVNTALRSGNGDAEAAMRSTYDTIDGAYALVDKAIQMFYNPSAINFAQIGSAAQLVHRLHEDAMAVGHYLLAGDFFANHERYNGFLDLLKDPQLLRLYRHTVDRPAESRSSSCHARPIEIFHPVLARHEERRQQALREVRPWTR